jgi:hypothetical protein
MRMGVTAVALAAVAALAACGTSGNDADASASTGDNGTAITEVALSDGTTCKVIDGTAADLSCNWQGPRAEATTEHPRGDNGTEIAEVTLRNGVHCAGMVSRAGEGQQKALHCNWRGERAKLTEADPKIAGTAVTLSTFADGRACAMMDGPGGALDCGNAKP